MYLFYLNAVTGVVLIFFQILIFHVLCVISLLITFDLNWAFYFKIWMYKNKWSCLNYKQTKLVN